MTVDSKSVLKLTNSKQKRNIQKRGKRRGQGGSERKGTWRGGEGDWEGEMQEIGRGDEEEGGDE